PTPDFTARSSGRLNPVAVHISVGVVVEVSHRCTRSLKVSAIRMPEGAGATALGRLSSPISLPCEPMKRPVGLPERSNSSIRPFLLSVTHTRLELAPSNEMSRG